MMDQQVSCLWKPSYSVDNPVLDLQHRRLLNLCLQVSAHDDDSLITSGRFHHVLSELVSYVDQHFKVEEAFLGQWDYPLVQAHQAEHLDYRERLTDFLYQATVGNISLEELRRYLSAWWLEHILGSDMSYARFKRQKH